MAYLLQVDFPHHGPFGEEFSNAFPQDRAKHRGEPAEKPGLIGAFCRTYTITEAIAKFLPEAYTATGHEDRYTYANGSTAAGLVIYDDKFADHHGTDPASGKLCNAFDLVRLHLYGHLDADTDSRTPVNKIPSYLSMMKLAGKDNSTKQALAEQDMTELRELMDDELLDADDKDIDLKWMNKLDRLEERGHQAFCRKLHHDP